MVSGGEVKITYDPSKVKDTDANKVIDDLELQKGIQGTGVDTSKAIDPNLEVNYLGDVYKWKDIKDAAQKAMTSKPGDNLDPAEFRKELVKLKLIEQNEEVRKWRDQLKSAQDKPTSRSHTPEQKQEAIRKAERGLEAAKSELQKRIEQAQRAGLPSNDAILREAKKLIAPATENGATGSFSAQVVSQPQAGAGQGAQGVAQGQGFRAMGGTPFGVEPFDGLNPPSTAAFMRAMYADTLISDGLGDIGRSRREGQRLMMLFFYFARMAESGDLGAMYQFIKFINYIIAKDKARQNIQISSKLIQLQDLSRKATDALMAAKSDDQNQNEFMKAMHKARSDEATISTSQKLLADMLQEFAHVVETLTNSVKNLLDAWGRVQRTASSR